MPRYGQTDTGGVDVSYEELGRASSGVDPVLARDFADDALRAARDVDDPGAWLGDKVHLRAVYEQYARGGRSSMPYRAFAVGLLVCHRLGLVELARLDLVEVMDGLRRWDVEGEVRLGSATFHMLVVR